MVQDLNNKTFDYLKVLGYNKDKKKWKCQCECGNTTYVKTYNLTSGNTRSCGCMRNIKRVKRIKNKSFNPTILLNKIVGKLKVINISIEQNKAYCFCLQCNKNTIEIPIDKLIKMYKSRRKTYTCGINNCHYINNGGVKNLPSYKITSGMKFGSLIVLQRLNNKIIKTDKSFSSIPMYKCKCDCGNVINVERKKIIK